MVTIPSPGEGDDEASVMPRHPLKAAAILGGAAGLATAGFLGARALARRNSAASGQPCNAVMAAAITACELKAGQEGS
jgi:hypothetical protein